MFLLIDTALQAQREYVLIALCALAVGTLAGVGLIVKAACAYLVARIDAATANINLHGEQRATKLSGEITKEKNHER